MRNLAPGIIEPQHRTKNVWLRVPATPRPWGTQSDVCCNYDMIWGFSGIWFGLQSIVIWMSMNSSKVLSTQTVASEATIDSKAEDEHLKGWHSKIHDVFSECDSALQRGLKLWIDLIPLWNGASNLSHGQFDCQHSQHCWHHHTTENDVFRKDPKCLHIA